MPLAAWRENSSRHVASLRRIRLVFFIAPVSSTITGRDYPQWTDLRKYVAELPVTVEETCLEVYLLPPKRYSLAHAQAVPIHQEQQRPVSGAVARSRAHRLQQPLDLVRRQELAGAGRHFARRVGGRTFPFTAVGEDFRRDGNSMTWPMTGTPTFPLRVIKGKV